MLISVQRRRRNASASSALSSSPSNQTEPPAMRPFSGSRRVMASAVVVLPQPDSPTRPTASPASTSKLMPSTARAERPSPMSNSTTQVTHLQQGHVSRPSARSCRTPARTVISTLSMPPPGAFSPGRSPSPELPLAPPQPRVEDLVERGADERERQDHDDHRHPRRHEPGPHAQGQRARLEGLLQDAAPGPGVPRPDAQERQRRLRGRSRMRWSGSCWRAPGQRRWAAPGGA